MSSYKSKNMSIAGGGLFSWASKLKQKLEKGANVGSKLVNLYKSNEFKKLLEFIPSSDERATIGYEGEAHSLVKLGRGRWGLASFLGPGSAILERLRRDGVDSYRTPTDAGAEMHDMMYYLAQEAPTREQQIKLVREADEHMIKTMKIIKKDKLDYPINIALGLRLIQAKIHGENLGALQKASFSGIMKKHPPADVKLVKKSIEYLKKLGY
tara:strand:- start:5081 stop:5713 length:633 start_codon:yes stop_codon:yes gene_type:complete